MTELISKWNTASAKALITTLAVFSAIALPQVFHFIGILSGTGSTLGASLLPMYVPAIMAGLLGGPVAGIITAVASPLISSAIFGMPATGILPYMTIELAVFGLVSGLLFKKNMPVIVKVLISQAAGRSIRILVMLIAIYGFGSQTVHTADITNMLTMSLPGVALQWALIPLLMHFIKKQEGHDRS